jgi:hypothetical protein
VLLALLAAWPVPAIRADELKPFEVSYTILYHGFTVAESALTLVQRDDDTWVYSSKTEPRGLGRLFSGMPMTQSVMRVTEAGVQPLSYRAGAETPSPKRDINVQFNWENGHVTGVYQDSQMDLTVPPGTQDDLSIQIALLLELMRGHTPEEFFLLEKKAAGRYRYMRERDETISTRIGQIPTIVYKSTKVDAPATTRMWCAPSFGYLPMRVVQKMNNGTEFTLQVLAARRD